MPDHQCASKWCDVPRQSTGCSRLIAKARKRPLCGGSMQGRRFTDSPRTGLFPNLGQFTPPKCYCCPEVLRKWLLDSRTEYQNLRDWASWLIWLAMSRGYLQHGLNGSNLGWVVRRSHKETVG